jgi:hypothetical protein
VYQRDVLQIERDALTRPFQAKHPLQLDNVLRFDSPAQS